MYTCSDCGNAYVSHQSLNKHTSLYCKERIQEQQPSLVKSFVAPPSSASRTMPTLVRETVVADSSSRTLSSLLDALYCRDSTEVGRITPAPSTVATSILPTSSSINSLLSHLWNGNLTPPRSSLSQESQQQKQQQQDIKFWDENNESKYVPCSYIDKNVAMSVSDPRTSIVTTTVNSTTTTAAVQQSTQTPTVSVTTASAATGCDNIATAVIHCFDEVLVEWMDEILCLEGKVRSNAIVKGEVAKVIDRMLEDGLISNYEHQCMLETNKLFVRLHDLIHMKTYTINRKREIIDILATLFEIGRLTKNAFVELCVNI